MKPLNLDEVQKYVNDRIGDFHESRLRLLAGLKLHTLLKKNPYLFRAKNMVKSHELIESLLEARLSSSEEKLFGDFLEDLAVFIVSKTCNGHKSTAQGVDLEFINHDVHYVVSVKSGPNWGNSSQQRKLAQDLNLAVRRVRQSRVAKRVQPVLGICYGKTRTTFHQAGYLKVVGQNFWYLISENPRLYIDIIEPIGHRAREHNEAFLRQKTAIINRFTHQFTSEFCNELGEIDWEKLVTFNSGNFDLDKFLS
ncbi:MAG: cytosolic protein [Chloroflexi bacterium]|nr:cytosolic protein [Chloroflexota bacterium]